LLKHEIEQHFQGTGKSIAWAALEDTTSSILKEFGYDSRVTARSKDGGVDIILGDEKNDEIYVQVKHSRNKVGVRVLRELVGTMAINSKNRSLLVTSSDFTRGVINEQKAAENKGFVVELVDGNQILSALNLTERLTPPELADIEKVAKSSIQLISEERDL
jgi:HJR/Mrr/RecB family endonuclease